MEKIETKTIKPNISFIENDSNNYILNTQDEFILDKSIDDIESYIRDNSGKGKDEKEKDILYEESQKLWHSYVNNLRETKYNFYLNRPQYRFLTDLILTKMEYDVNTIFFAIELTNVMGNMKDAKYLNDTDIIAFPVNATEITYIYHLISKHTVKGLRKESYLFSEVLYRIGNISKIFNYYEEYSKRLSEDIKNWVYSFEDGVTVDNLKSVNGELIKPK